MPDPMLVLGDSHARVFFTEEIQSAFPFHNFDVVLIAGATVSGLENPNAKTKAIWTFMDAVEKSKAKTIIVLLGEVDTGFVIWYRAAKYKAEVSEMLDKALKSYQKFLHSLAEYARVICISAPLPTKKRGKLAGLREGAAVSRQDRTQLTTKFNKSMKGFCETRQLGYIDLDDESMGDNGIVSERLVNKCAADHHYDPGAYAELLIPRLQQVLQNA